MPEPVSAGDPQAAERALTVPPPLAQVAYPKRASALTSLFLPRARDHLLASFPHASVHRHVLTLAADRRLFLHGRCALPSSRWCVCVRRGADLALASLAFFVRWSSLGGIVSVIVIFKVFGGGGGVQSASRMRRTCDLCFLPRASCRFASRWLRPWRLLSGGHGQR